MLRQFKPSHGVAHRRYETDQAVDFIVTDPNLRRTVSSMGRHDRYRRSLNRAAAATAAR
jgi:hypothetical protein